MKLCGMLTVLGALVVSPCLAQEFTLHEDDYASPIWHTPQN
jgi:hypothetical protein